MRRAIVTLALLLSALVVPSRASADSTCQFILGFKTLHDLDPTDVGDCLDDQVYASNGDAQQHTKNGLLAWRKVDNWTAFTNGYWTWINGPNGLVKRLNTERFSWEANPDRLPIANESTPAAAATAAAAATPVATPSAPTPVFADQGIAVLPGAVVVRSGTGKAHVLAWVKNTTAGPLSTTLSATMQDAKGAAQGDASGVAGDLQPGETRLVELLSQTPFAAGATAGGWRLNSVYAGSTLPSRIHLGKPQPATSTTGASVTVAVTNGDAAARTGSVSVAVADGHGAVVELLSGVFSGLGPGQTAQVQCLGETPLPAGAQLTPQLDVAI